MLRRLSFFTIALFLFAFTPVKLSEKQKKEIVFCLDMSASTNGLISDIRDNLWRFVNHTRMANPEMEIRIGIIGYGRPSFGASNDYVRIISDLTDNYDFLSEKLFEFKINVEKGDQMVGSALYAACRNLSWNSNSKKTIFLFGNGSVEMGRYNYLRACDIAADKNITIYPVYCVQRNVIARELPGYKTIARKTGGSFNTLQLSHRTPLKRVSADALWLKDLNDSLNHTYIYYSKNGADRYRMLLNADKNSIQMNEQFFYARTNYKVSEHYQEVCSEWDLISLMKINPPDFNEINMAYLPKDYQQLTPQELYEIAMRTKEKRNKIVSDMKTSFLSIKDNGQTLTNPIDSMLFQH